MKKGVLWTAVICAVILSGSNASAAELGGVDIHGFISQGYLKSDDNNFLGNSEDGSFQFNEMGINFSRELTDKLRIGVQFFSRDLSAVGNNDVVVDWAYGDYRWRRLGRADANGSGVIQ
ncbi:hypothetical protein DENIS_4147 [Desulfonema ishimotonii]|uniref:Porin n=1 Tax=Desulfonema ishimotonii TaxID=45657 RepID=A0A401G1R5_9BACT|nr:hypothetical protein [Desulfonema ishimotonii]GBC63154.1 hypothetical protein DENIS_4147 [Desulfonema ishimotonii]